jgi:hypothetical protein
MWKADQEDRGELEDCVGSKFEISRQMESTSCVDLFLGNAQKAIGRICQGIYMVAVAFAFAFVVIAVEVSSS